jgi:hypothetical protein
MGLPVETGRRMTRAASSSCWTSFRTTQTLCCRVTSRSSEPRFAKMTSTSQMGNRVVAVPTNQYEARAVIHLRLALSQADS